MEYFQKFNLSSNTMKELVPSNEREINLQVYRDFQSSWSRNIGLNNTSLEYSLDFFALFFSYRLLQRHLSNEERMCILQSIVLLCDWCSSRGDKILLTKVETDTLLVGLLFQNQYSEVSIIIEKVMSNTSIDTVGDGNDNDL